MNKYDVRKALEEVSKDINDEDAPYTVEGDCFTLYQVVNEHPKFSEEALKLVEIASGSKRNDAESLKQIYKTLGAIIKNKPELASDSFEIINETTESNKNSSLGLSSAILQWKKITKKTPEFAEQALDSIHNIMKLDKVNANVLHSYFDTLDSIATVRGDLSDKIFEMIEDGFKSNENDYSSKRMGYVVVHNLGKHNPLQFKMDMLRKKLKDNIGKTASKENGEVSPENKETAKEQTTMSKTLMKAQRYMQGKHNY